MKKIIKYRKIYYCLEDSLCRYIVNIEQDMLDFLHYQKMRFKKYKEEENYSFLAKDNTISYFVREHFIQNNKRRIKLK